MKLFWLLMATVWECLLNNDLRNHWQMRGPLWMPMFPEKNFYHSIGAIKIRLHALEWAIVCLCQHHPSAKVVEFRTKLENLQFHQQEKERISKWMYIFTSCVGHREETNFALSALSTLKWKLHEWGEGANQESSIKDSQRPLKWHGFCWLHSGLHQETCPWALHRQTLPMDSPTKQTNK